MRTTIPDESVAAGPGTPDETLTDAGHDEAEPIDPRRSRRSFVFFGALAAAALLPKRARAQSRQKGKRPIDTEPKNGFAEVIPKESVAAFEEWDTGTSRLVRRVTLGMTQGELQRAAAMGCQGYLNYQLNYTRINDDAVEAAVATRYPLLGQTADVLFSADAGTGAESAAGVDDLSRRVLAAAAVSAHGRVLERPFQPGHRQGRLSARRRPARRDSQERARQVPGSAQGQRAQPVDDGVSRSEREPQYARPTRTTRARSWSSTRSASTAATRRTTSPSCRAC